jgi:AcrR family transcriptional regulator
MLIQAEVDAPRRRQQRLSPADRRQQIVEAAISFFAEVGFDGGTRDLAKRLGITQPLIYRYFPSKEDLIRAVYDEVYLRRWQSEWEAVIADRTLPLRQRLITFYEHYTAVIFGPDWIRIYLFSGLRGLEINQWWITFVETHVLRKICEEIRWENGLADVATVPISAAELDLYWMFHGGIFYFGMRREVYKAKVDCDLVAFITNSVDSLLQGYPATIRGLLNGTPTQ